jgi:hypothetical protein
LRDFRRNLSDDQKKLVPKAAAMALGRVGTTVRKEASTGIRQRIAISAAVAKGAIKIKREGIGSAKGLILVLEASGRPIPLRDYQARQGRRGVTYRVSKSGGRKTRTNKYGTAFIVQGIGGNVFIRTSPDPRGPAKAKITQAFGPSIPQYFTTRIIRQLMTSKAQERWPIEFQRAWIAVSRRR